MCDKQRLKPLGGERNERKEEEQQLKSLGSLVTEWGFCLLFFLAGRCCCPPKDVFPAPKVLSLLAETLHPALTWERQEGAIRTWEWRVRKDGGVAGK